MKISSAEVNMQAQHQEQYSREVNESLEMWIGARPQNRTLVPRGAAPANQATQLSLQVQDWVQLSQQAYERSSSKVARAAESKDESGLMVGSKEQVAPKI